MAIPTNEIKDKVHKDVYGRNRRKVKRLLSTDPKEKRKSQKVAHRRNRS